MNVAPTVSFSFIPTCHKLSCLCCCGGDSDDEKHAYPNKKGKFVLKPSMSPKEIKKANERFENIIRRKIDPLPLDTDEFLRRLVEEEGIDFEVTVHNPLTKERVDDIVAVINHVLSDMHVE